MVCAAAAWGDLELSHDNGDVLAQGVMGITFQAPQPCQGIMEEVERLLGAAVSGWTFDMFALADATLGHPVSTLAYYLRE